MQEEIKCPQCGGNKFKVVEEEGVYKCIYCGSIFYQKQNINKNDNIEKNEFPSFGEPIEAAEIYYQSQPSTEDGGINKGCLLVALVPVLLLLLFVLYLLNF